MELGISNSVSIILSQSFSMPSSKKDIQSIGIYYLQNPNKDTSSWAKVVVPIGGLLLAVFILTGVEGVNEKLAVASYSDVSNKFDQYLSPIKNLSAVATIDVDLSILKESKEVFTAGVETVDYFLLISAQNNIRQTAMISNVFLIEFRALAEYYLGYLSAWWKTFKNMALSYIADTLEKWKEFIYGSNNTVSISIPRDDAALREQIRLEILAELETSGAGSENQSDEDIFIEQTGPNRGVLVLPASSTPPGGIETLTGKLSKMFSDPVDITFDNTNQSGVIVPRFSGTRGNEFFFLITLPEALN